MSNWFSQVRQLDCSIMITKSINILILIPIILSSIAMSNWFSPARQLFPSWHTPPSPLPTSSSLQPPPAGFHCHIDHHHYYHYSRLIPNLPSLSFAPYQTWPCLPARSLPTSCRGSSPPRRCSRPGSPSSPAAASSL